jgi:hypothetical protein
MRFFSNHTAQCIYSLGIEVTNRFVVASKLGMMIRRIFAGSIVALLLSVTSLAAACDLSCAFASMSSDCHAQQTKSQGSAPGGMTMGSMAMAGMMMPEMANDEAQPAALAISRSNASHPSIGEMGPCERQACDNGSAIFVKAARSGDTQFHSLLAATEIPSADGALAFIRDARNDIAHNRPSDESPLLLSLRI